MCGDRIARELKGEKPLGWAGNAHLKSLGLSSCLSLPLPLSLSLCSLCLCFSLCISFLVQLPSFLSLSLLRSINFHFFPSFFVTLSRSFSLSSLSVSFLLFIPLFSLSLSLFFSHFLILQRSLFVSSFYTPLSPQNSLAYCAAQHPCAHTHMLHHNSRQPRPSGSSIYYTCHS